MGCQGAKPSLDKRTRLTGRRALCEGFQGLFDRKRLASSLYCGIKRLQSACRQRWRAIRAIAAAIQTRNPDSGSSCCYTMPALALKLEACGASRVLLSISGFLDLGFLCSNERCHDGPECQVSRCEAVAASVNAGVRVLGRACARSHCHPPSTACINPYTERRAWRVCFLLNPSVHACRQGAAMEKLRFCHD